jgi:hypothetical protein
MLTAFSIVFGFSLESTIGTEGLDNGPPIIIILCEVRPVQSCIVSYIQDIAVTKSSHGGNIHHVCDATTDLVDTIAQTKLRMALLILAGERHGLSRSHCDLKDDYLVKVPL